MKKETINKAITFIYIIFLFLFVVSFSIAMPIYNRWFYYLHIDAYDLPNESGYTHKEIKEAYDDVLDFLLLPNKEFKTGVMDFTENEKSHFEDCKILFTLDTIVLIVSAIAIITIVLLKKKQIIKLINFKNKTPYFYSGIIGIVLPTVLGILVSLNFDKAFVIFHKIFFPGKQNWQFDWNTDEIIRVMPEEFFRNCAILIGIVWLVLSIFAIRFNRTLIKKQNSTNPNKNY